MNCSDTIEKDQALLSSNAPSGDHVLEDFKAGMVRSMKQAKAGKIRVFDDIEAFLSDLNKPE